MTATINASTSAGVVTTADTSGILQLQTNGTAALTVDASQNVGIGTASPAFKVDISGGGTTAKINTLDTHDGGASLSTLMKVGRRAGTGTNAYINTLHSGSDAVSALTFAFGTTGTGTEAARIDSSGNVMVATTSAAGKLNVAGQITATGGFFKANGAPSLSAATAGEAMLAPDGGSGALLYGQGTNYDVAICQRSTAVALAVLANSTNVYVPNTILVGKTASSFGTAGIEINPSGGNFCRFTRDGGSLADFNRLSNDGELIGFWQATTQEGSISVSGTTVSYNGGHLSRWAQTTAPKDDTLVKGTVLSNLDAMNVYTDVDGNPVDNEQLNKVKVSDVEGDANVAGVFVNWSHDEDHNVDEINMAMTGDMIIRIAQGTTVARGDLLMSAGDGTAKPQGDDIVRSKTVAKVTSTHVTCTYADGSFCVPCVLMAC